jgi:hypothetical protein
MSRRSLPPDNVVAFPVAPRPKRSRRSVPNSTDALESLAALRRQIIEGKVHGFIAIGIYEDRQPHRLGIQVAGVARQSADFVETALMRATCHVQELRMQDRRV